MNELSILSQALAHTRRSFLLRTVGTVAFPMSLAACGGGGGGDSSASGSADAPASDPNAVPVALTRTAARGKVVMPTGASVQVASITNVYGSHAPAVDGSFDFASAAESRLLAIGADASGTPLLYGLLQDGKAELSARSTAVVIAYVFLGVGAYLEEAQVAYITAIEASSDLPALERAVAAALVARGSHWLDSTDATLVAALTTLQASLSAPTPAAAAASRAHAQGISLDKTERTSGLQVTTDGIGSLQVTNYYRRRSSIYVDRVSYRTEYSGPDHDSKASIKPYPTQMPAVKGVSNVLVTLAEFFAGNRNFYQPITASPVSIPLAPSEAVSTHYVVTALGLGAHNGDVLNLTNEQALGLVTVTAEALLFDLVVPIFCGIFIPSQKKAIDAWLVFANGNTLLKDLVNAIAASPNIIGKAKAGKSADAGWDALLLIVKSDQLKRALLEFMQIGAEVMFVDSTARNNPKFVADGAKPLLDFISNVNIGFVAFDTAVTALQISNCNIADQFSLDVTKSNVKLNPLNPFIDWPVQQAFTLSVIDAAVLPGSTLSYTWSCGAVWGDINDGEGHSSTTSGTTFDSDSATLTYAPNSAHGRGGDTDVITGIVYLGQIHQRTAPLGKATTTITYNAPITPPNPTLTSGGKQIFTAGVSPRLPAGLTYLWTLTGGHGDLGFLTSEQTTTVPSIEYKAGAGAGTDTLSVKVQDASGRVLTVGSTTITVLENSLVAGIVPQNPQVPRSTVLNFVVNPVGASFPDGTTFKWVLTGNLDLFGRPTDLGGSGGGAIGVNISPPSTSGRSMGTSMTVVTTTPAVTFAANPFGPEAVGEAFSWYPRCDLLVSVLSAGGSVLATSSTPIQTQLPRGILLP